MTSRRTFIKNTGTTIGSVALSMAGVSSLRSHETPQPESQCDYIVVGAGSAGCVVASRLSEDANTTVLLLEAGGMDDNKKKIHDPRKWAALLGSDVDWKHTTEKEASLNGRKIKWPTGKVLGGTSAINAMIYIRGHRINFDHWNALGNEGWSYDSVLPYFKKSENNRRGASHYHGFGGPLNVMDHPEPCEFVPAMVDAAKSIGYGGDPKWDFNDAKQEDTAGSYQFTIKDRKRHSAADAFLRPAMHRPNLTIQTNSFVTQLRFAGDRVTGVDVTTNNTKRTIRANREVIVCAGAINSPKLLMVSGIGPPDHLQSHRIKVKAALRGVGQNLQDHPHINLRHHSRIDTPSEHIIALDGGLFVRSKGVPDTASPNIQFIGAQLDGGSIDKNLAGRPLWSFLIVLTQPQSRGTIRLRSDNPFDQPLINANYLKSESDRKALLFGLELGRRLARQRPLQSISGDEVSPGFNVRSNHDLNEYLRNRIGTTFHPVGTCKMGQHDELAVVDSELRVRGVEGLRVADASIMPVITNGNTNAPTLMIGEKAAAMIKKANG